MADLQQTVQHGIDHVRTDTLENWFRTGAICRIFLHFSGFHVSEELWNWQWPRALQKNWQLSFFIAGHINRKCITNPAIDEVAELRYEHFLDDFRISRLDFQVRAGIVPENPLAIGQRTLARWRTRKFCRRSFPCPRMRQPNPPCQPGRVRWICYVLG